MALPKFVLRGRKIILLSGFKDEAKDAGKSVCAVVVSAEDKLRDAAKRNPNAVAFDMWQANGLRLLEPVQR